MSNRNIGGFVILTAIFYGCITTNYFDNHFFPQSGMECVVDGIGFIIIALGLILMKMKE